MHAMRSAIDLFLLALLLTACGASSSLIASPPQGDTVVFTPVYTIQGNNQSSPLEGSVVSAAAIVTGDFQDNDADSTRNLGGFYIQEAMPDSDPSTSDGIFVFDGNSPTVDVNVGDRVTVDGTVTEHFGETQISAARVELAGSGSIRPTDINLPATALIANSAGVLIADLERYEGMLVRFPQMLTINGLFNLERYGEVRLSQGGRTFQFSNQEPPDAPAYDAHRRTVASRSVMLDDGARARNVTPVRYLTSGAGSEYSIRSGDAIARLSGNLRYSRGSGSSGLETYRLMPTGDPEFEALNPRPGPPTIGGSLRVASINVLNFFSTIDTDQAVCGPDGNEGCRGADSSEEFDRQLSKIITALSQLNADIVGLIELENNDAESLTQIVDGLNTEFGPGTYVYLDTGVIGLDAIKTGFIYKPANVSLRGPFALLDASVDARFNDARNRNALAQTFVLNSNGGALTIIVNHLKSKGSDCDSAGDPNLGDGQGNCNKTRTDAATAIADWLALDPTSSGDPDFLIIGDLNAYVAEDPLTALKNAGFVNLVETASGAEPYSFVFDAQFGALDHALASPALSSQVVETIEWHINADEPPIRDYNLEFGRDPALFDAESPYRISDHDPIIIGIDLSD
jgi:predicted extracellular nuclease